MMWHVRARDRAALRTVKLPPGVVILTASKAAIELATEAYGQNSLHQWILGRECSNDLIGWMVSMCLARAYCVAGSILFGIRGSDGSIVAIASVVPYPDGLPEMRSQTRGFLFRGPWLGGIVRILRSCAALAQVVPRLGRGVLLCKGASSRMHLAEAAAHKCHQSVCRSARPHLHVGLVAVKTTEQGKKHASQLLRHITTCADELSLACYASCSGEHEQSVFGHFGFQKAEEACLTATDGPPITVWGMERPLKWYTKATTLQSKHTFAPKGGSAIWIP